MNLNLDSTLYENALVSLQDEVIEHLDVMRGVIPADLDQVMLLSDPDYPGAYRVWVKRAEPDKRRRRGQEPTWVWVDPDGEIVQTQRPWAVQ